MAEVCESFDCVAVPVASVRIEGKGWFRYCRRCAQTLEKAGDEVQWDAEASRERLQGYAADVSADHARLQRERDQLDQQVRGLEGRLAECYRLTGSDPDGDSDSMLAQHAVQAVRELREEADKAGEWEERAVEAERQVRELLSAIHVHGEEWDESYLPKGPDRKTEPLLAAVWDDDQKLYAAADKVRKERGE